MKAKSLIVYLLQYPGVMKSAVEGMREMFTLTNNLLGYEFFAIKLIETDSRRFPKISCEGQQLLIIPPAFEGKYYLNPEKRILDWIARFYRDGHTVASVCAGIFILAPAIDLTPYIVTTHWNLESELRCHFPSLKIDTKLIVSSSKKIMTAGGLMAWMDLALAIIHRYTSEKLVYQLGRKLIIDTKVRTQQYYISPEVKVAHQDQAIRKVQHHIAENLSNAFSISQLAKIAMLGERTLLRRFKSILGVTPIQYIHRLRVERSLEFLQQTNLSMEQISYQLGIQDVNFFRKIFNEYMGILPRDYREKFKRTVYSSIQN